MDVCGSEFESLWSGFPQPIQEIKVANFVLVHGAAHGAWCWSRVVPIFCPIRRVWVIICFPWSEYGGNSRMGL